MALLENHPGPEYERRGLFDHFRAWCLALVQSRRFQDWAARFPLTRSIVRRDGERLFDLISGFTYSQVLHAFVEFNLAQLLADGPRSSADLALRAGTPPDRMAVLCQAAAALDLLHRRRDGRYDLARLGAALPGVPGLQGIILHHSLLYRDLSDPAGFFRGETETEIAGFWPYVFCTGKEVDTETAAPYSRLMSDSQILVAGETIKAVNFSSAKALLDIGGGTGTFLEAVGSVAPHLALILFDLPAVVPAAIDRFEKAEQSNRIKVYPGNFRFDPLPGGADMISLVRVLYDHEDQTVRQLLASIFKVLPKGGRLLISEPMSGGARPQRAGDAYFALYCMAMRTGTVRSAARICALLSEAGFANSTPRKTSRPFITQVVTAEKP